MLLIGMSGAEQGEDVGDPEFAAALKSVVIEKSVDAAARPSPCAPNQPNAPASHSLEKSSSNAA